MQKRSVSCVPVLTAGLFAAAFALAPRGLLAASDCLEQPNRASSQSGHWYYHVDRTSGRKCWHLSDSDVAARPPQPEPPPPPAPDTTRQPAISSFFSSLTAGFNTASVGASQPAGTSRDLRATPVAPPDEAKGDDTAPPKHRQRADAKPSAKPDRQASSRSDKEPPVQSRPASLDQAERDALFQQFLRWRERQ